MRIASTKASGVPVTATSRALFQFSVALICSCQLSIAVWASVDRARPELAMGWAVLIADLKSPLSARERAWSRYGWSWIL
jgi:hypothetical protein